MPRCRAPGLLAAMLLAAFAGTGGAGELPPTGAESLLPWLQAGRYTGWMAETAPHASDGPHFGKVRAFLNAPLAASLGAGELEHATGAAAVKELYGMGNEVRGWAVAVKLPGTGGGGSRWYWFEYFDGRVVSDARGASLCASCHTAGRDYVLSPWPLP